MMRRIRAAVKIAALALCALPAAAGPGVIPQPAKIEPGSGSFKVSSATIIQAAGADAAALQGARYLSALWKRSNQLSLPIASKGIPTGASLISFRTEPGFAAEAYRLKVSPHRITISATTAAGLFYGAVTLWQLLPAGSSGGEIAAQTIIDEPRYPWRGLMLDSARHFQSPVFVRSMIDWMAWHKLNVLHWHLTDDQGWRLQIRKYPKLTSVGAWRIPASVPGSERKKPYGGFYTQQQVREIVAFAATRHVQIVPEIDMPGHAQAAIAAYPELGAIDSHPSLPVSANWGVHSHLFNLEPGTFEFLEDVLDEVMQLFPSRYIHIGGDEAVKDEWNASSAVKARARQLGISDANALQTYFTQKISGYLAARARRAVGWDEILQPGLAADAVVMSWHGASAAHAAAIRGNDTVLAPDPQLYLDHRQSPLASEPPGRIVTISVKNVYEFEPHDAELSPTQQQHVLGLQADLWTEYMRTERQLDWMALPRAAALAEVGWSPLQRNWPDFLKRLAPMFARYRDFGINYADSMFGIEAEYALEDGAVRATLSNLPDLTDAVPDADIHYTLNGGEPKAGSPRYSQSLDLPVGTQIRAATFLGSEQVSRIFVAHLDSHTGARRTSHQLELCSNGISFLLEPGAGADPDAPFAVDIMNPCWIYRGVDLTAGPRFTAAVAPLPFNYELGADAAKIRVGDARSPEGELEIHIDGCETPPIILPLAPAAMRYGVTILPAHRLPTLPGRHDICMRFARPHLDPLWVLDWAEIGD
jgi:hexosaminidase